MYSLAVMVTTILSAEDLFALNTLLSYAVNPTDQTIRLYMLLMLCIWKNKKKERKEVSEIF